MTLLQVTITDSVNACSVRIEHGILRGNRALSTARGLKDFGPDDTVPMMVRWAIRSATSFPKEMALDGTLTQFVFNGEDMFISDNMNIPTLKEEIARHNLPIIIEVLA